MGNRDKKVENNIKTTKKQYDEALDDDKKIDDEEVEEENELDDEDELDEDELDDEDDDDEDELDEDDEDEDDDDEDDEDEDDDDEDDDDEDELDEDDDDEDELDDEVDSKEESKLRKKSGYQNYLDNKEKNKAKKDKKKHRRKKHKSNKKTVAIVFGSILGVLAVAYIAVALYFGSHFLFFTKINGIDCSMKSANEVKEYMERQVANYSLTLQESDGSSETIDGADISIEYVSGNELEDILDAQNNWLWITSLLEDSEVTTEIGVKYDEDALEKKIQSLACMQEENQVASSDAHPEFQEDKFVVAPEVIGTQINAEILEPAITEAINGFQTELVLEDTGCYIAPKYTSDSTEVTDAVNAMNNYLGAEITYDFDPYTEVVDSEQISQWVSVDSDMKVTFNEAAVGDYVMGLAEKYNTIGSTRTIVSGSGSTITVDGGAFGWQIDQESEVEVLLSNIKNGEVVTREPEYYSWGKTHEEGNDIGSTFAEVDLTNQVMYYVKDGQVVMKADVVTGNPTTDHATPSGVYSVMYKQLDATLRGDKDENGNYEWETPVKYWMQFTSDGCGFHDATWQSAFGGDRYLTYGSHGCVNMSYDEAGQLYDIIQAGDPVVVHY